jgi:AcrR family transcriptional regulator
VLDVARREFAAQGFAGATMRSIATAAGVTPMALYNYAPSKAALFATAWADSIEQIYTDYEHVVAGRGSLVEEVDALFDRSRELLVERPEHIRLVLRVLLDHEHPDLLDADLQPRAAVEFYEQLADRGVKRGEITRRDREHLITSVVTLLWGITMIVAFDPSAIDQVVDSAKWAVRRQLR